MTDHGLNMRSGLEDGFCVRPLSVSQVHDADITHTFTDRIVHKAAPRLRLSARRESCGPESLSERRQGRTGGYN